MSCLVFAVSLLERFSMDQFVSSSLDQLCMDQFCVEE